MARISSLISWLMDFLRRHFARRYEVKCSNVPGSPKKHDFRRCPKCGKWIDSLNRDWINKNCTCRAYLLQDGFYQDKRGREYSLEKPLRSPWVSWWVVLVIVSLAVLFAVSEYHSFVPSEIYRVHLFLQLAFVCFAGAAATAISFLGRSRIMPLLLLTVVLVVALYIEVVIAQVTNHGFVFRWQDVSTRVEWETAQNEKAVAEFETLVGLGKIDFALKQLKDHPDSPQWFGLSWQAFLLGLEADFSLVMGDFHDDFLRGGEISSKDMKEVLALYRKSLDSSGSSYLRYQCLYDPWNLATAEFMARYPYIWEPCRKITNQ